MASPAKKRKLNNSSKTTPKPSRNLDYFFGKKKEDAPSEPATNNAQTSNDSNDSPALTDEQLARKLQAEWNKEANGGEASATSAVTKEESSVEPVTENGTPADAISEEVKNEIEAPKEKEADAVPSLAESTSSTSKTGNTLSLQSTGSAEDTISANIPFDESPLTFDPSKYVPELQGHWAAEGGNASYALLTRCFVLVNGTQSRIKIVDTLVNMLRVIIEGDPSSLLPTVWLATNSISPPYISLELGLGGSAISKALKNICGLDNKSLKALYDKVGDAGDVAFEAKKKQSFTLRKPKPLTIKAVYQSLVKIANSQGTGSAQAKQRIVDRLLQDARGAEESRYIVRTLCQHVSAFCYYLFRIHELMANNLHSSELVLSKRPCSSHYPVLFFFPNLLVLNIL